MAGSVHGHAARQGQVPDGGAATNSLVYLPFLALFLVISTRVTVLEILTLPLAYERLFAICALLAVSCAVRLRREWHSSGR